MILFLKLLFSFWILGVSHAKSEAEIRQYFLELGLACNEERPIRPRDMVLLQQSQVPDNEKAKCFLACVYRKATWFDQKGMFDVDAANAMIEKEHIDDPDKEVKSKQLFDNCKKVNDEPVSDGEKGCERAAALMHCLVDTAPKMGLKLIL